MKVQTFPEKRQDAEYDLRLPEERKDVIEWGIKLAMQLDGIDVINSLHGMGFLKHPEKIVKAGPQALLKGNSINKRSLKVIASLLQDFDYIEDANDWLGEKPERPVRCPNCGHKL